MSVSIGCDECGREKDAEDGVICPQCFSEMKADRDDLKSSLDKSEEYQEELQEQIHRLEQAIKDHVGQDVLDSIRCV